MNWQDLIFSVGNIILAVSLIPSVKSEDKPHLMTSIPIAIILLLFGVAYLSLGLILAATTVMASSFLWELLAHQKYQQNKR